MGIRTNKWSRAASGMSEQQLKLWPTSEAIAARRAKSDAEWSEERCGSPTLVRKPIVNY